MGLCSGQEAELSAQEACSLHGFYATETMSGTRTKGVGYRRSFSFVSKI